MTTRIQPWTEQQLMDREAVFENLVEKSLNRTMRAIASKGVEDVLTAAATLPVDPTTEGAYSALQGAVLAEWTTQVDASLYPFLTTTFTDSASRVVDGVQEASGIIVDQLTGTYADEVLQYAYNRMVGIGESLWLNIRDQLVEGYNAGESIPQIAERLTQVAGLTTPRALTVARTEIISAANNGSYLQMLDAGFDEAVTKVWLATEDTRTRLSHRHADNQGVDLTGEFNVDIYSGDVKTGTEPMEFPGDPTATPGNIINCRCSLAFDFEEEAEEVLVSAAAFTEKEHPRDKDGKFKKKGAADKYFKIPDVSDKPASGAPLGEKINYIVAHKWDSMTAGQKNVTIKNIDEPIWQKLPPELKEKVLNAPSTTSNPIAKDLLEQDLKKIQGFQDEPDDDDADTDAGKRALGGIDTKTGKALIPGKPIKLRVQILYNTKFDDGAIMAVRKDSGERVVWNENTKKIERQKLSSAGKYETTEALSRGAAYAAWKDENGWTVPDPADVVATPTTTPAAQPSAPAVGKPVKIKVQLIYQTPFDDGDIVAVNPTTGETIHWDAKKKRMVVTSELGTTEYTRGALYKQFKDEDGWHLPVDKKAAIPAPAPVKKDVPPAKSAKPAVKKAAPAPAPVATPEPVSTYVPSAASDQILQAVDNDIPGQIYDDGKISVALAKNGNLLFLDATPNGGVGIVKSADVNSENIDKALTAVKAGKTWTVDDAIPDVDPDEIDAPGASQDVLPAQDVSPVSSGFTEDKLEDIQDGWSNVFIDEDVYEDDSIKLTKVSKNYVEVYDKKTGKSTEYKINQITPEHISDFLELNVEEAPAVPDVSAPVVQFDDYLTDLVKSKINDPNVLQLGAVFDDGEVEMLKGGKGNLGIFSKTAGGGFLTLQADEITTDNLNKAYNDVKAGKKVQATAATAVSADKVATIKSWVDQDDIPSGEELHNGADFKIYKAGPGTVVLYKKSASGDIDPASGQLLADDEITAQGIQNTLSQMGAGSPVAAPAATNVTVTDKVMSSPSVQLPLKMSYGLLVNPKTTNYKDGQIIAENPSQGERLVWDGIAKKYLVQVQGASGDWTQIHKYSKQAAYKELKDDPGWVTPSAPFVTSGAGATPGTAPSPSVTDLSSTSFITSTLTAPTTGVKPKFTTVELNDASDSKLAMLSDADVKKVFDEFKTGKSTMYLTSSDEDIFDAVLRAQKKFNEANPGVSLNMLETVRLVDQHSAKVAGVTNKNLFQQKLINWLESPAGKKKAPQILHEFRLSPAEKAKLEADKKAAEKAKLDAKLKDFHAIVVSKPHTGPFNFKVSDTSKAGAMQTAMLKGAPWTAAEKDALKKYTGSYYHTVNGMLRGKSTPTDQTVKDAINIQKGMRPLGEDLILYRGTGAVIGVLPDNLAAYNSMIGTTFVEPAFSSTSINNPFGGKIKMIIEAPKGTPAAYVKSISNFSSENEVLLGANTKFQILEAKQNGYSIEVRVRVVP